MMVWGDNSRTKKIRDLLNGVLISANKGYKNTARTSTQSYNEPLLFSTDNELAKELRKIADMIEKHNI